LKSARAPFTRRWLCLGLVLLVGLAVLAAWKHNLPLLAAILPASTPIAWMLVVRSRRIEQGRQHIGTLFDSSPIPAALTRAADGTFLEVNAAFLEMTGHSREEVIGRTSIEVSLWSSPGRRARGMKDLLEKGTVRERAAPFRRKSGELAHALFSAQVIEGDAERRVLLLMQDITPRNRAEEAVRAKEAFLTALVNNTDDLLLAVDRQLRITMMNDALRVAVRRNYGFELAVGDDVYRLVVPERRAELEGIFSRALQGQRQHVESAFRLPSGRQVSQDEAYNPIIDAGGNVTGVSIFVHDVSAQRRAAQTIQSIVKGTAAALGEAFFRSLVRELAAAVGARYALVGELSGDRSPQIRTVAVSGDGSILDNFGYDLSHTPCAAVIRDGIQFYPEGLGQAFPENAMLRDLGIQSYLGLPLQDRAGQAIGLLAVLDDKPMRDSEVVRTLLGVFAARAGAELDRLRLESEKRVGVVIGADGRRTLQGFLLDITLSKRAEGELRLAAEVFQSSGEAIVITDAQHCIRTVNPAFSHITGYAAADAVGKTPYSLSPSVRSADRELELWAEVDRNGYWQGEVWDRRRNGEVFPKWLTSAWCAIRRGGRSTTSRSSPTSPSARSARSACGIWLTTMRSPTCPTASC